MLSAASSGPVSKIHWPFLMPCSGQHPRHIANFIYPTLSNASVMSNKWAHTPLPYAGPLIPVLVFLRINILNSFHFFDGIKEKWESVEKLLFNMYLKESVRCKWPVMSGDLFCFRTPGRYLMHRGVNLLMYQSPVFLSLSCHLTTIMFFSKVNSTSLIQESLQYKFFM